MSIQATTRRRRLQASLGLGAVAVSFSGIFLAAALSPTFSLFGSALSDLGTVGTPTAPLFNGAVLVAGALGAGFVASVWDDTEDPVRRGGLVLLLPAMLNLSLVGVFPIPNPFHFLVSILFFFFLTLGVFVWGAGDFAVDRRERGGALVVASTLHVAGWVWRFAFGWAGPGVAVPELVGAATLALWALWLSYDRWPDPIEPERL